MMNKMPPELKEEMMEKLLEAIKSGKVKAVSIAFEGGEEEDFKPHKMYDEEGEAHDADTYEKHKKMEKMGYKHKEEKEDEEEEDTMMEMKEALKNVKNLKKYSKIMK